MSRVADDDSEVEDEKQREESAVQPRDSGCFESSDNLEGRREEPKTEGGLGEEAPRKPDEEEQVDDVQQQLQQLTVDEEP